MEGFFNYRTLNAGAIYGLNKRISLYDLLSEWKVDSKPL